MHDAYVYEMWTKRCHGTWVRFEMFREPSPCGIGFSMWCDKCNHVHPMWSCIINVYMFLRQGMWSTLTGNEMNELKYDSILGGYLVQNLCVLHVDPMGWSILARLGNPDMSSTKCLVESVLTKSCGSLLHVLLSFFHKCFLVSYAYEKREINIALLMCIFVNCLTCVVYEVDAMYGLCCTYVMCEWFYP